VPSTPYVAEKLIRADFEALLRKCSLCWWCVATSRKKDVLGYLFKVFYRDWENATFTDEGIYRIGPTQDHLIHMVGRAATEINKQKMIQKAFPCCGIKEKGGLVTIGELNDPLITYLSLLDKLIRKNKDISEKDACMVEPDVWTMDKGRLIGNLPLCSPLCLRKAFVAVVAVCVCVCVCVCVRVCAHVSLLHLCSWALIVVRGLKAFLKQTEMPNE